MASGLFKIRGPLPPAQDFGPQLVLGITNATTGKASPEARREGPEKPKPPEDDNAPYKPESGDEDEEDEDVGSVSEEEIEDLINVRFHGADGKKPEPVDKKAGPSTSKAIGKQGEQKPETITIDSSSEGSPAPPAPKPVKQTPAPVPILGKKPGKAPSKKTPAPAAKPPAPAPSKAKPSGKEVEPIEIESSSEEEEAPPAPAPAPKPVGKKTAKAASKKAPAAAPPKATPSGEQSPETITIESSSDEKSPKPAPKTPPATPKTKPKATTNEAPAPAPATPMKKKDGGEAEVITVKSSPATPKTKPKATSSKTPGPAPAPATPKKKKDEGEAEVIVVKSSPETPKQSVLGKRKEGATVKEASSHKSPEQPPKKKLRTSPSGDLAQAEKKKATEAEAKTGLQTPPPTSKASGCDASNLGTVSAIPFPPATTAPQKTKSPKAKTPRGSLKKTPPLGGKSTEQLWPPSGAVECPRHHPGDPGLVGEIQTRQKTGAAAKSKIKGIERRSNERSRRGTSNRILRCLASPLSTQISDTGGNIFTPAGLPSSSGTGTTPGSSQRPTGGNDEPPAPPLAITTIWGNVYCERCFQKELARWVRIGHNTLLLLNIYGGDYGLWWLQELLKKALNHPPPAGKTESHHDLPDDIVGYMALRHLLKVFNPAPDDRRRDQIINILNRIRKDINLSTSKADAIEKNFFQAIWGTPREDADSTAPDAFWAQMAPRIITATHPETGEEKVVKNEPDRASGYRDKKINELMTNMWLTGSMGNILRWAGMRIAEARGAVKRKRGNEQDYQSHPNKSRKLSDSQASPGTSSQAGGDSAEKKGKLSKKELKKQKKKEEQEAAREGKGKGKEKETTPASEGSGDEDDGSNAEPEGPYSPVLPCMFCTETEEFNRAVARRPYPRTGADAATPWVKPLVLGAQIVDANARRMKLSDFQFLLNRRGAVLKGHQAWGWFVDGAYGKARVVLYRYKSFFEGVFES
ncbi:hypothetical protein B0T22DRAFT_490788 [Podospora appendiculata]|uniref:Uncharacterized protein n=1 Tax=Podospora appendiculata TaxID=314037 RepID=A0AAE0XAY5_9PEZI|nr:hypothetical protein B0T22DRAFT_490788 [Podospora appendiculata]